MAGQRYTAHHAMAAAGGSPQETPMHIKPEQHDHHAWTPRLEAGDRPRLQQLAARRPRLWCGLLAASTALALLLAFHQVVLGGVHRAEIRHQAQAMLVEATRRCQALRGAEPARLCLQGLGGQRSEALPAVIDRAVPARPAVLLRLAWLSDGVTTR